MARGGTRNVRLMLTPRADTFIAEWKRKSGLDDPILDIGWGRWNHESDDHWMLGLHDRAKLGDDWPGWVGIAPEFVFVVINPSLFDRLEGCILDVGPDGSPRLDDAT
jgi:hypothetical protein